MHSVFILAGAGAGMTAGRNTRFAFNEMRRRALAIAALASLMILPLLEAQSPSMTVYKRASPSVFLIETDRGGGTGFCVSKAGVLATSLHVVDEAKQVSVRQSGAEVEIRSIDLIGFDSQRDLALLKLSGQTCIPLALGDSDSVQPGQRILVLGNPLARRDLASSISDGLVSGIRHLQDYGTALQISAPLSPGNSGGPVLDETGRALGIVAFKLTEGELLNFAIPINDLKALLHRPTQESAFFSWSPSATADAYRSDAYRLPTQVVSIFAAAQETSRTCQLKDVSWTSEFENSSTHVRFEEKKIERRDFGSITSRIAKDKDGNSTLLVSGKSINGKWRKRDGKIVSAEPLSEDDIVSHIVDNWYCFCQGTSSLWRDVTVSEAVFEGEHSFKVHVQEPFFGSPITFWFSKEKHVVIGREFLVKTTNGVPRQIRDTFSDFRAIDGFTVPLRMVHSVDGVIIYKEDVRSFKANVGYPDYMFEP